MSPDSPTTAEIAPDPQLEKRTRRRFSAPEKLRLLAQADALAHGEQGAWLRRNGLYAAQLSAWRKQQTEHGLEGLQSPYVSTCDPTATLGFYL
jgi:transposase